MTVTMQLLLDRAGHAPGGVAIIDGRSGRSVTWGQVLDQAERWEPAGLPGPVGLAVSDPLDMAVNFLAALAAGVTVAPLDAAAPGPDRAARIALLGLRAVVTGPDCDVRLPAEHWIATSGHLHCAGGAANPRRRRPEGSAGPALLMASSGTTGTPKIVPLTEGHLLTTARGVARHLGLEPGERGYSPLPLFHINGLVVGVLSALVAGSSIVVDRQFSRRAFWATAAAHQVTWVNLVPAMIAILGQPGTEAGAAGTRVRLARSASAPLPAAVRERFEAATGVEVVETYGMTEAASQITANPLGAVRPGSVGRPVGFDLRVVDASRRPVPAGTVGDVEIRGGAVTSEYWSAEPGDAAWSSRPAVDAEGWLATADQGRVDGDGYLYLVGRAGDVINRGGEKILPREIEEVLLGDARVAAAVVVGRSHPVVGEEPVAYVLAAPSFSGDPDALTCDLAMTCETQLSRYKRPAAICVARNLPAGPTGKVRRAEVKAMAEAGRSPSTLLPR